MEQKFALATSKKLHIIDLTQNCGVIGIALAQLIPDACVIVLDDGEAIPTIESNVRSMSAAMAATVAVRDWNAGETPGSTGRPSDLIFATAFQRNDHRSPRAVEVLRKLIGRSPRAVVVVVEEEEEEEYEDEDEVTRLQKTSPIPDLMSEYEKTLRGTEHFPGGSILPQYHVTVYHGSRRR